MCVQCGKTQGVWGTIRVSACPELECSAGIIWRILGNIAKFDKAQFKKSLKNFFCSTGDGTRDFAHNRQGPFHLTYIPSPLVYFCILFLK